MKKIKIFATIICVLLLTGCVKMDMEMTITKTGKVKISIIEAVEESLMTGDNQIMDKSEEKKYKEAGFEISDYKDEEKNMKGVKITKNYSSIDLLTGEPGDDTAFDGETLTKDDSVLFSVKKGFFKNTYTAKLKSTATDDITSQLGASDDSEMDMSSYLSSMDLKFRVNLPYKANSNNATEIENGGKTLVWDLTKFKDESFDFEFDVYNLANVGMVAGGVVIVIVLLVVVISKATGGKKGDMGETQGENTLTNMIDEPNMTIAEEIKVSEENRLVNENVMEENSVVENNVVEEMPVQEEVAYVQDTPVETATQDDINFDINNVSYQEPVVEENVTPIVDFSTEEVSSEPVVEVNNEINFEPVVEINSEPEMEPIVIPDMVDINNDNDQM